MTAMTMSHQRIAATVICSLLATTVHASVIERTIEVQLGTVADNPNGGGQVLFDVASFFPDDPIPLTIGDTLILNLSFANHARVELFDFDPQGKETLSFGLDVPLGSPGPNGATWTNTITLLDPTGGAIVSFTKTLSGGGGIGYGGADNLVDNTGSFSGIRWEATVLSALSGFPNIFTDFTGVQITSDRIVVETAPLPATLLQQLLTDVTGVGPGKSLANKVALAQTYYAVPDVQSTCAVLTDFLNEVKAQSGKKVTTAQANSLSGHALVIMLAIACK
jgi:hypothetical protein